MKMFTKEKRDGKRGLRRIALALTLCMALTGVDLPVAAAEGGESSAGTVTQAEAEYVFGNNGYPYVRDNMTADHDSVTLTVDLEKGSVGDGGYQWMKSEDGMRWTDIYRENASCDIQPENGYWYKCKVKDTAYESKAIRLAQVQPDESILGKDTALSFRSNICRNRWYAVNGNIAYWVGPEDEMSFDVMGLYTKNGKTYWVGTSFNVTWAMVTDTSASPQATGYTRINGSGQLKSLRVSFREDDPNGVYFEAQLPDDQHAFAIGADTMLGNSDTSKDAEGKDRSDEASLKAIKDENGKVRQVQMVGAMTVDTARATDPAFVIKFDEDCLPAYHWLGEYQKRLMWSSEGSSDDFNPETASESADSGMTASWSGLTSDTSVKFSFHVGSVKDAGAAVPVTANATSTSMSLSNTEDGFVYRLTDANGNWIEGQDWVSPDAEGNLTFSGLTPDTSYKVVSKQTGADDSTKEDVLEKTTAIDPLQGAEGAAAPVVSCDYETITVTNPNPSYSYCLVDETGKERTKWQSSSADGSLKFNNLTEDTTYYLVAKTDTNTASEKIAFTTKAHMYTVTYYADGATSVPAPQTVKYKEPLTTEEPVRPGYKFKGWGIAKNAHTVAFRPGDPYTYANNRTLYAIWEQKAAITLDAAAASGGSYTGSAQSYTASAGAGQPADGYTYTYYIHGTDTVVENPTDAGSYDVRITRPEDDDYQALDQKIENALVITKAEAWNETPDLGKTDNSFYNKDGKQTNDGCISGVSKEMEYRKDGEADWTTCDSDSITGLEAGTYHVRYRDNANHVAGPETQIIIEKGSADDTAPTAQIRLDEQTWDRFLDRISFDKSYLAPAKLTIDARDAGSGIGKISYWIADEQKSLDQVKANGDWTEAAISENGQAGIDIKQTGKAVVYFKIEDKVGNVTYYSTDGMQIYGKDDVVTVSSPEELESALALGIKHLTIADDVKDFSLNKDLTLPEGTSLEIPTGVCFTIPTGKQMKLMAGSRIRNKGTFLVKENAGLSLAETAGLDNTGNMQIAQGGSLVNAGSIASEGKLENQGSISNSGTISHKGSLVGNGQISGSGEIIDTTKTSNPPSQDVRPAEPSGNGNGTTDSGTGSDTAGVVSAATGQNSNTATATGTGLGRRSRGQSTQAKNHTWGDTNADQENLTDTEDEQTARAETKSKDKKQETKEADANAVVKQDSEAETCHWQFMILALMVAFLILLFALRKAGLAVRLIMLVINLGSSLAFALFGACRADWVCFIIDAVVSIVALCLVTGMQKNRK